MNFIGLPKPCIKKIISSVLIFYVFSLSVQAPLFADNSSPRKYYLMKTIQVENELIELEKGNSSYKRAKELLEGGIRPYLSTDPNDTDAIDEFMGSISGFQSSRLVGTNKDNAFKILLECEFFAKYFCDNYGIESTSAENKPESVGGWLKYAEIHYSNGEYQKMAAALSMGMFHSHPLTIKKLKRSKSLSKLKPR